MKVKTFTNGDASNLSKEVNDWAAKCGAEIKNASTSVGEIEVRGIKQPGNKPIRKKVIGFIMTVLYED